MKFPSIGRACVVGGLSLVLLGSGRVAAEEEDWTVTMGDLGRNTSRVALNLGGHWSAVNGTEVEKVDSATGFEVGIALRAFRTFSLFGSYAVSTGDVDGQLIQLLDQEVRPDGRSGNVSGELETRRFRAGVRVDALREKAWQFRPYLVGAAVFATSEVTIDTVDQAEPLPIPLVEGGAVDISRFEDSQLGAMGRFGVEYHVVPLIGIDFNLTFEVFELPAGTNAATSVNGGITFRI